MRVMWPPLPPGFGILVRFDRTVAIGRPACRSFILRIEREPLAIDHLAVLRDRHADAAAAFGMDQLTAWGIVSGYSPPWSSKRRAVPSMRGSCGRFSGVISANL